jgi:hypothetical protein
MLGRGELLGAFGAVESFHIAELLHLLFIALIDSQSVSILEALVQIFPLCNVLDLGSNNFSLLLGILGDSLLFLLVDSDSI